MRPKASQNWSLNILMKFEKKIEGYFASLDKDKFAYIRNPFTANAQMLQTGTGTQEELVKL